MISTDRPDVGRVLVCMPTYNEIESLPVTAAALRTAAPWVDLLVVDDGSPDGTGALADSLAADDTAVHVLHRTSKDGLGAAYTAAFEWALTRDYDVIVEMDADGSHPAAALPALLRAVADGADLALGSRWVAGGRVVNWPKRREVLSRGGNTYVRLALGLPLRDATGGFRAYRAEVLKALPLQDGVQSHGYCFQVDLAWQTWLRGFTIVEVPITFTERVAGESKMSGSIVREALLKVTGWAWTSRRARPGTARAAKVTGHRP